MDELQKIKLRRVLPGVVSGVVLCGILLYAFYSLTPNQRMERMIDSVLQKHGFVKVGETSEELTTSGTDALVDLYEAPKLEEDEIASLEVTLYRAMGGENVGIVVNTDQEDVQTFVFSSPNVEVAEIRLVPVYKDGEGEEHTRLKVRRHKEFSPTFWELFFG